MEVLKGIADIGFCGSDVFNEGRYAGKFKPLGFKTLMSAGCELVLAAPKGLDTGKHLRIATSFPLQTVAGCSRLGYKLDLESLDEWGGKIEAKISTGAYDAIVDLRSSGETLEANNLIVYDVFDSIQTGLVFRKEEFNTLDYDVPQWRMYCEWQTLLARKKQLDLGEGYDPEKKSSLHLLSNQNKRMKNLGEEVAELVLADALGEDVVNEACDVAYAIKIICIANGVTPMRLFNEDNRRNTNPTLGEL